jgi:hypothetical protein
VSAFSMHVGMIGSSDISTTYVRSALCSRYIRNGKIFLDGNGQRMLGSEMFASFNNTCADLGMGIRCRKSDHDLERHALVTDVHCERLHTDAILSTYLSPKLQLIDDGAAIAELLVSFSEIKDRTDYGPC